MPCALLELHLMDLIPSSEMPDVHIVKDPDNANLQRITAASYETVAMAQILKDAGGERVPYFSESQKDFLLAFIDTRTFPATTPPIPVIREEDPIAKVA